MKYAALLAIVILIATSFWYSSSQKALILKRQASPLENFSGTPSIQAIPSHGEDLRTKSLEQMQKKSDSAESSLQEEKN